MKFLYSDTQDYVDPNYDFIADRSAPSRERYWDDVYAHEIMHAAPYDGLLVAMSAVRQAKGVAKSKVRYSTSEEQLLLRIGARKFLRFDGPDFRDLMLLGDCGAFAYADKPEPAYSPEEVVEFYLDAEFTHGISPDHVIFECNLANPDVPDQQDGLERYQITLENARKFIGLVRKEGSPFEPLGAVQGWSPQSMAEASAELVGMGYRYLAIGGLVPLKVDAIKQVLETIRRKIGPEPKLHLLGFAKADHIHQFTGYGITSFDSTSPLIRAFKDETGELLPGESGGRTRLLHGHPDPAGAREHKADARDQTRPVPGGGFGQDGTDRTEEAARLRQGHGYPGGYCGRRGRVPPLPPAGPGRGRAEHREGVVARENADRANPPIATMETLQVRDMPERRGRGHHFPLQQPQ